MNSRIVEKSGSQLICLMSNPLMWLWEEFISFLADLQKWADPPTVPPNPPESATTQPSGRVLFVGTDLPFIEPLERLLEEAWSYLKAQEHLIADETQALQALQKKIEINQRWVQFYESGNYPLQPPTPHECRFDRNRHRCYRQELAIFQQIYLLRRQKVDWLNSNRAAISMMLDNLRSELLKIDSYHTSIDRRFGFTTTNTVYTEADIQTLIDAFTQKFNASKVRESRTIARFNQELGQLTKTWKSVGFA